MSQVILGQFRKAAVAIYFFNMTPACVSDPKQSFFVNQLENHGREMSCVSEAGGGEGKGVEGMGVEGRQSWGGGAGLGWAGLGWAGLEWGRWARLGWAGLEGLGWAPKQKITKVDKNSWLKLKEVGGSLE
jgi:hypothetical protein